MCFYGESVSAALYEEIDAAAKVCCSVKFADHMHPNLSIFSCSQCGLHSDPWPCSVLLLLLVNNVCTSCWVAVENGNRPTVVMKAILKVS
jgi:predicted RNA-binding Zn-ribbon protein involved in translation (DUF1610 family)